MKKLLIIGLLIVSLSLSAQTTHNINWFIGADPGTMIIEEGDTVNWIWTDGAQHSVTSDIGAAMFFDSGILPNGSMFQVTFPDEGVSSYFCQVHPSMFGAIDVRQTLGVGDSEVVELTYYPNPVVDFLYIDSNDIIDTVQLFDIAGKKLMDAPVVNKSTTIYMEVFKAGLYFVTINSEYGSRTIQVVLN